MSPAIADLLFLVTSLTYLAASGIFVGYLVGLGAAASAMRYAPRVLAAGACLHAAHIVVASLVAHVCPVEGIHFAMSVVSLLVCVTYLGMRLRVASIDVVGAFVAPLALTSLLASRFVRGGTLEPGPRFRSALLPLHVTMNLLGVALFSLAFAAAVAYLVQEKQLKKKRLEGIFQRLPPLDSLDRAEHRFLLAGFPLLTIGVITGTLWAKRVEEGGPAEMARAAFAYATWLLFAAVLLLRAAAGWRGRRAAYGTIAGFSFAVLVLILYLLRTPVPPSASVALSVR
jgi:ABC-type uncharacterized transport system permease subunit